MYLATLPGTTPLVFATLCQIFLVRFSMKLFLVRHGETVDNVAQV